MCLYRKGISVGRCHPIWMFRLILWQSGVCNSETFAKTQTNTAFLPERCSAKRSRLPQTSKSHETCCDDIYEHENRTNHTTDNRLSEHLLFCYGKNTANLFYIPLVLGTINAWKTAVEKILAQLRVILIMMSTLTYLPPKILEEGA